MRPVVWLLSRESGAWVKRSSWPRSKSVSAPSSVTKTSPCWKGDMVPGSTFRYGSNFIMLTRRPRLSSRQPMEAAARPLPKLDTTQPVTKTYFADIDATSKVDCWDWTYLVGTIKYGRPYDRREEGKLIQLAMKLIRIGID